MSIQVASRIIYLLNNATSPTHIRQIQTQLILHKLHQNTTLAHHFISASQSFSLLSSILPLFLTHLHKPHVFTCNILIKAFSHGPLSTSRSVPFSVYTYMRENSVLPNNFTFPFLLKSLSDSRDLQRGQFVHTHVVKLGHFRDIYVDNSLMDLYASCGEMGSCRKLFDEILERDVVSWTILITGYRDSGNCGESLVAFEQMQYAGVVPNRVTMVNALAACASLGAIETGVWIHEFIRGNGWELDVKLGTSLVDMYMSCGRISEGMSVCRSMPEKNVYTWNVVIKGLALARCGEEAIWWFNRMEEEGVKVDKVTLVNVLSACSHSGLIDIGKDIFSSLVDGKYGFLPGVKHYACMVDLFSRAGCLDEAFKLIREMSFWPTKSMWGSLLGGSKAHGNFDLSELAAKMLLQLEPDIGTHYVVLSNLYAEMGRWSDVMKVRELMREKGLNKDLGFSSVRPEFHEDDCKVAA